MIYQFADFFCDTARMELRRSGEIVEIEPQAFSVLAHLIENRDRIVSKDELIDAIWSGRAISDGALTSCINAVRRALGDSGNQQSMIKTVPRRGYRFVGQLPEKSSEASGNRVVQSPPAPFKSVSNVETRLAVSSRPSIAVLPFANLSPDPEQEYFADGITQDIITALSRLRHILVIARTTTFAYKNQAVDVPSLASDLDVRYVLEGSVRKAGDRIRITGQLIDGETGNHLWADRYDRDLADIFDLQDEISVAVASTVNAELGRAEEWRARTQRPENLDAWTALQKGISYYYDTQPSAFDEAEKLFRLSIEFDPVFALAHGYLSLIHSRRRIVGFNSSEQNAAFTTAWKAIELDHDEPIAHFALATCYYSDEQYELAGEAFQHALTLDPSLSFCRQLFGRTLGALGRHDEAIAQFDLAITTSPRDPLLELNYEAKAASLLALGDFSAAANWARRAARSPRPRWARAFLISALGNAGKIDQARTALEEMRRLRPEFSYAYLREHVIAFSGADQELFLQGLKKAGLKES